jgi:AcrR family transcriptional regulator
MTERPTTRRRILDAARRLFNAQGYSETTISQIADAAGIAHGNVWYHFRTKTDIVDALKAELAEALAERRAIGSQGRDLADEYVTSVLVGMQHQGDYRFVLRDALQFRSDEKEIDAALAEDHRTLRRLVRRLDEEEFFRRDLPVDLEELTRSLFIVARYWSDHVQDHEGRDEITWDDQVRGLRHHLGVLRPWLTAAARRAIDDAAEGAIQRLARASPA